MKPATWVTSFQWKSTRLSLLIISLHILMLFQHLLSHCSSTTHSVLFASWSIISRRGLWPAITIVLYSPVTSVVDDVNLENSKSINVRCQYPYCWAKSWQPVERADHWPVAIDHYIQNIISLQTSCLTVISLCLVASTELKMVGVRLSSFEWVCVNVLLFLDTN